MYLPLRGVTYKTNLRKIRLFKVGNCTRNVRRRFSARFGSYLANITSQDNISGAIVLYHRGDTIARAFAT